MGVLVSNYIDGYIAHGLWDLYRERVAAPESIEARKVILGRVPEGLGTKKRKSRKGKD